MADETSVSGGQASDAGQRYAQALFDLAVERDAVGAVEGDLNAVETLRSESDDLRRLLASPAFGAEAKAQGLALVADKGAFHDLSRRFLQLIARNRRAGDLPDVVRAFRRLSAQHRGVVAAEIVTATPLSDSQSKAISTALRERLGKAPEITTKVDPSILGGLRVRVGSRLYDASLKSRLDRMRHALTRA